MFKYQVLCLCLTVSVDTWRQPPVYDVNEIWIMR